MTNRSTTADGKPRIPWDPKRRISLYAESEADKDALGRGARVAGVTRAVFLHRILELHRLVVQEASDPRTHLGAEARLLLRHAGIIE